jgi:hypothetical protein
MVVARSAALTPVVTPFLASTLTVNCVPKREEFVPALTCSGRCRASAFSCSMGTQMMPLVCRSMSARPHLAPSSGRPVLAVRVVHG